MTTVFTIALVVLTLLISDVLRGELGDAIWIDGRSEEEITRGNGYRFRAVPWLALPLVVSVLDRATGLEIPGSIRYLATASCAGALYYLARGSQRVHNSRYLWSFGLFLGGAGMLFLAMRVLDGGMTLPPSLPGDLAAGVITCAGLALFYGAARLSRPARKGIQAR